MGTRSLTYVYDSFAKDYRKPKNITHPDKPMFCFYRQFDGYIEGHGKELATFLLPFVDGMLNGYNPGTHKAGVNANGMGCLAAQMIQHFKASHGIGGIYIQAPDLNVDSGQEYEYHVYLDRVKVIENGYADRPNVTIFDGDWVNFAIHCDLVVPEKLIKDTRTLREMFADDETVEVVFTKADGTERRMTCTQCLEWIPEEKHPYGSGAKWFKTDRGLYKVFDMIKGEWRSFREERIISYRVVESKRPVVS